MQNSAVLCVVTLNLLISRKEKWKAEGKGQGKRWASNHHADEWSCTRAAFSYCFFLVGAVVDTLLVSPLHMFQKIHKIWITCGLGILLWPSVSYFLSLLKLLTTQPAHFVRPFAFYHSKPAPSVHTFGKGIQNYVFILLQCQKAVIH